MTAEQACERFEEMLSASADGEMRDGERAELSAHLMECDSCISFQAEVESMQLRLTRAAAPGGLWKRIELALPSGRHRLTGWPAQAAAAVLIAIGAFQAGRRGQESNPVSSPPGVPSASVAGGDRTLLDLSGAVAVAMLCPGAEDPERVLMEGLNDLARTEWQGD